METIEYQFDNGIPFCFCEEKQTTDKGNFRWKLVIYRGGRYFVFICTLTMVEPNVIFEQSHRRLYGAPVKLFEP